MWWDTAAASIESSRAPTTPRAANSVNTATCCVMSTSIAYMCSISRALWKQRLAYAFLPTPRKMRASSSQRVGTKCGTDLVNEAVSSSKWAITCRPWRLTLRFAHSRSPTRFTAWWAFAGSWLMGQVGNPAARARQRPTSWEFTRLNPTDSSARASASTSSAGMIRTMVVPLV